MLRAVGAEVDGFGGRAGRTERLTEHRFDDDPLADARSTVGPIATIWPQASAPWMRGKLSGAPVQPESSTGAARKPAAPPAAVDPTVTDFEYQPVRILMSVLLTPAARTRTSASPGPGVGTGRSVR